jgi:hypothetical protein
MRHSALLIIFALAAPLLNAQPAGTIVVNDSLAAATSLVDEAASRNADSLCLASTVPLQYPVGRAIGTMAVADLVKTAAFLGGATAGGLLGAPLKQPEDEFISGGTVACMIAGGTLADVGTATAVIHDMNKKYVTSSPWYAAGGLVMHYAAGAGLMYLLRKHDTSQGVVGIIAYLTAPISGTAAYLLLGKSKPGCVSRNASR